MKIEIIPCLSDNYSYLIFEKESNTVSIVDPSEFNACDRIVQKYKKLDYILNTHHHLDHVDGNLKLKEKYNSKVGYSGHEASVGPSIFAAGLGADCIERHITLDRAMYGSDQAASLEERGLATLVSTIRKLPNTIGAERNKILDIELSVAKKLRYWENL